MLVGSIVPLKNDAFIVCRFGSLVECVGSDALFVSVVSDQFLIAGNKGGDFSPPWVDSVRVWHNLSVRPLFRCSGHMVRVWANHK